MEIVSFEGGILQEKKCPNYFKVFYNMAKKIKVKCVKVIFRTVLECSNHGIIQTCNVLLDLQKIFWTPLFSSSVCGERIGNF